MIQYEGQIKSLEQKIKEFEQWQEADFSIFKKKNEEFKRQMDEIKQEYSRDVN